MDEEILFKLREQANSLIQADKKVVEAFANGNFEDLDPLIRSFCSVKVSLQAEFGSFPAIEGADDETHELLQKVQGKFFTDLLLENLQEGSSDIFETYGLSNSEVLDIGSDLLYSWISHHEFVRDLFKMQTLILKCSIPKELNCYLKEARNCFALQQPNAAISLCRTILEAAAKDLCEKLHLFAGFPENIIEINPKVFNQLIRAVSRGKLKRKAIQIYYRDACPVMHGDRVIENKDALKVLRETLQVIQELYASKGF